MTGTNANRDPESVLAAWLDEGPTDLPDATRRAILTALPTTPQARRGLIGPWPSRILSTFASGAATALVIIVLALGALALIGSHANVGGPPPTPTANVFQSSFYGFAVTVPPGWTVTPATVRWDGRRAPSVGPDVDLLTGPHLLMFGYAGPFSGDLPAFVQDRMTATLRDQPTCPANALLLNHSITIGGQPGVLLDLNCGARIEQALTVKDGVGYAFTARDPNFAPTINPTELATVRSVLDGVTFPANPPFQSP